MKSGVREAVHGIIDLIKHSNADLFKFTKSEIINDVVQTNSWSQF